MNKEIKTFITRIENVNSGEPWFGRSVSALLEEVDPRKAALQPKGGGHSMLELLWHMNTWASFTLKRIQQDQEEGTEGLDWRVLEPGRHTWKKGIAEWKSIHRKILQGLKKKEDPFLQEKVGFRSYDFRFLLNGLIEHNIYHAGQIAYLNKFF